MDIVIDFKNYTPKLEIYKRIASRAIVSNGDKYLMITSKFGDYKFPGGGRDYGESLIETLIRETQEETGYYVIESSIEPFVKVFEKRKKRTYVRELESYYFLCEVEKGVGERNLDDYEIEFEYENVWITLEEAIEKNKQVKDLENCPWVVRELRVMEELLKK